MPNWLAYLIWIVMHAYIITFWWVKKNIFLFLLFQSMSAEVKRVFLTGHQHPHRCIWRDVWSLKGRPLCIKLRCTFVLFLCASGNRSKISPKIKKATKDRPFKRIKKSSFFFSFLSNEVSSEKALFFFFRLQNLISWFCFNTCSSHTRSGARDLAFAEQKIFQFQLFDAFSDPSCCHCIKAINILHQLVFKI